MNPERWQQIEQVYYSAEDLDPGDRDAFLAKACGADVDLRREVESLLAAGNSPDTLLGRSDWEAAADLEDPGMLLTPGARLGPYEILGPLGEGGMGKVYRGLDTRLGRAVAIKVSSKQYGKRFSREAQVLASLNHPNIAAIYGVEEQALVMELVEGPTLADRLANGRIPLEEALAIARQIAEALEAAHEKGVVHRDLKPANIKLTAEGKVKVLDFGLARVEQATGTENPQSSPTLPISATRDGVILGTAAYMAPEQARGGAAGKRADIWAFGVMLYEMLCGRQIFAGETVSDTLAAVLMKDPDWSLLPANTPAAIRRLLRRCLERNRKQRLADIADARLEIDEALAGGAAEVGTGRAKEPAAWLPSAIAGMLAVVAGIFLWAPWRATPAVEPQPLVRLTVDLGPNAMPGRNLTVAISPDGRRLVFPARGSDGKQQLATRLLDQTQTALLPGTEDGVDPFFSPDSQWVGFFADGELKKISVQGGAPVPLCPEIGSGGSWGNDGTIVIGGYAHAYLARVPAAGGEPETLTLLGKDGATHRWPQILPGGQAILFAASPTVSGMEGASVNALSLKSGMTKMLVAQGYFGRYLQDDGNRGYLVYLHQGILFGVAFNPDRLEIQGTPVQLLGDIAAHPIEGGGQFDFSPAPSGHGTLVYLAGSGSTGQNWPVAWLESSGKTQPLIATPGAYLSPSFSPDGRRLALTKDTSSGPDIYSYDLQRGTMTRLTFGGHSQQPVWTPDGKRIAFTSGPGIWWMPSDGSGEAEVLLKTQGGAYPFSFSGDGKHLACHGPGGIWTVSLDTSNPGHPKVGKPEPFVGGRRPMFSPDGRWIAYRSGESGSTDIYVRPFPGREAARWQISAGGGLYAVWSSNGRELFYETADNHIMVVDYTVKGDSFVPGKPRLWSGKQIFNAGPANLALAPDGKRFAVFPTSEDAGSDKDSVHFTFLLNFLDYLRRQIPGR